MVVATLASLAQDVPSPPVLAAATLALRVRTDHSPSALLEHLALSGFVRVAAVESPGEFSGRGGIVDVFPFGAQAPLRLDFFGDTLESIRVVDVATGRSGESRDELRLLCLAPERLRDPMPSGGPCFLLEHLPEGSLVALVEPATVAAKLAMGKGEAAGPGAAALAPARRRARRRAPARPLGAPPRTPRATSTSTSGRSTTCAGSRAASSAPAR